MANRANRTTLSSSPVAGQGEKKLLDRAFDALLAAGFDERSANAYVDWMRQFILFHGKRHPLEMGYPEIEGFLNGGPFQGADGGARRAEATRALEFLYVQVLGRLWPGKLMSRPVRRRGERGVYLNGKDTNIKKVQELLGHKDIRTTMIYLHVLEGSTADVVSPLDMLEL